MDTTSSSFHEHNSARGDYLFGKTQLLPSHIDRNFEQYLADHHVHPSYVKFPLITSHRQKQHISTALKSNRYIDDRQKSFETVFSQNSKLLSNSLSSSWNTNENDTIHQKQLSPINTILANNEKYRRSHAKLIEYKQQSKIQGIQIPKVDIQLSNNHNNSPPSTLVLREVIENKTKEKNGAIGGEDLVDDESIISVEGSHRAKVWVREHQYFFNNY
ncbi:unnamed protein product [Didymodactylos carnosus]|uniref:Uncharacterized protein n=1 Tax=Didymodactylos carnosus TaxID=1234261 RepID=A0A813QF70_9BILA|nr:unnamed protein product [Didymodactylos carnosus]CAF1069538.1 unnamed protein product [Didymodactylos carnosus]CAF3547604.1 unnamed protein product [Didymodactylos carnosus]CAF3834070.1 unnamed protein product [Didymodactylos carnosus]